MREKLRAWLVTHRLTLAIGGALFVLAAIAFRALRAPAAYWTIDDAGITYAAALQLVDHGSLATSFEGLAIEGYSNPLVFFVVALLRVFGLFDPVTTHVTLEMLVFATMIVLAWSMLRALAGEIGAIVGAAVFAILELATPATWAWYGSGLENVWVSAGLVAMLWLCVRTARGVPLSHRWGTLLFAVAITRPEAPVYVAACYAALATVARPEGPYRAHLRAVIRAAIVTAALFAVFLAWRRIAYGEWLPNTYYAKMHERDVAANVRDYVVRGLLPYARIGMFAMAALALLVIPKLERVAATVVVFLAASLALPVAAGADWMGEHRFGTPFFAMVHVAYAIVFAWCVGRVALDWRRGALALVAMIGLGLVFVQYDRNMLRHALALNDVTVPRIAYVEGGVRWEQQMRLGLPFPVVQMPDAGGSMLVGGVQMVDNGMLTDWQIARMSRDYRLESDKRELFQYLIERDPDLVSIDPNFWFDRTVLGTRYVMPLHGMDAMKTPTQTVLATRRDLVEAGEGGTPLAEGVRLSPETVTTAGPGGLVRIELFVAGAGTLRATIEGDRDELVIPPGHTRVAMLVGAPPRPGRYPVALALDDRPVGTVAIDVTDAIAFAGDADPWREARKRAWSFEQRVPRMTMTRFRAAMAALDTADRAHAGASGEIIMALRHNARLADKTLDAALAARLFGACKDDILCVGRTVDRLRRLGYLGTARFAPLATSKRDYRTLVGLVLARPDDLDLQRALFEARAALKHAPFAPL